MKKARLTRTLMAAVSIVALSAVMYGCVHSGDGDPQAQTGGESDADMEKKALDDAKKAAMNAADAAKKASDAAEGALAALAGKMDVDVPNYTRARDAADAAKAASDAAASANTSAQAAKTSADAVKYQKTAEAEQAKAVDANNDAMKYARMVAAAAGEADALETAKRAAKTAAGEARDAANEARAAANKAAEHQGASSRVAMDADAEATKAENAATAAETAAADAREDTLSADAIQEQETAEAKRDEAQNARDDAQGFEREALVLAQAGDRSLISTYREQAEGAKDAAARHAESARSKATMARAQATQARADANRAKSARTDYTMASAKAMAAERAATAAENSATAAEAAARMANSEYMKTQADDVTPEAASMARDEARDQRDLAMASDTGDNGANASYMTAKTAAADAAKYAGMNMLEFLQLLNGDDTGTDATRMARLAAVNTLLSGNVADIATTPGLARDEDNASAVAAATVTWNYHGSLGADTQPGGTGDDADTMPGEGKIGISLNTTPALTLQRDDPDTAGEDETNFKMGPGLGDFAEYHISTGTGAAAKARAIVFTDKEQAGAPIAGGNVLFSNKVPTASRVATISGATGTYDHDGVAATPAIAVTIGCPDGVACEVTRDANGDIASITGYRISTDAAGVTVAAVAEQQDTSYLAFGAWVVQAESNGDITYGAFANGSGTANQVASVNALTGKATYKGKAAGVHNTPKATNFFHADAILTADLGNATAGGTITGRIHNIVSGGNAVSGTIHLDRSATDTTGNIEDAGTFDGRARMGAGVTNPQTGVVTYPYEGVWAGRFYNAAEMAGDAPMSAAGTFGVGTIDTMGTAGDTSDDMASSFVGAFGAHRK